MGRYLIKTEMRVFEAANSAQLARLAKMGLVSRDALVKAMPDGEWVRAESHPDIGRLYQEEDKDRTVIAALPTPAGEEEPREKTGVFWVRTDVSTVEVRGLEVLQRLYELGVVRRDHQVSRARTGPFEPITESDDLAEFLAEISSDGAAVELASRSAAESDDAVVASDVGRAVEAGSSRSGDKEVSVVISLSEEEIEYFQSDPEDEEASPVRARTGGRSSRREVSNVIMLSASDVEIIDEQDDEAGDVQMLDDDFVIEVEEPEAARSGDDVILLTADDIEEFEEIGNSDVLPELDTPWAQFRRTMNSAAHRTGSGQAQQELTWDLFRGMMEKPSTRGPSESSWKRFQARLVSKQRPVTPASGETTWDRFRQLMKTDESPIADTTWDRFVKSMQERRIQRGRRVGFTADEGAVAGEARIKSDVVRVLDTTGPSVRVEGLEDT